MKLILKQCQVCGKTISADNGNIETEICNTCDEKRKLEASKKTLLLKNNTNRRKKKSKASRMCKDMEKLTKHVSYAD